MEGKRFKKYDRKLQVFMIYFFGLLCTCLGVSLILKTEWGLDAWNGVFAGLDRITPVSIGGWSMIIQGCFWILASILNRKADWLCMFPIVFKGIFLDISKSLVSLAVIPDGLIADGILFFAGYLLVAAGTGVYVATGYSKMPIDGLMTALATFYSWSIKKARLLIELTGFTVLLFVHGPFGGGTILITFTIGYVVSVSCGFAQKWLGSILK